MGDLSKNISRHEVACKCGCGFDTIDFETLEAVQKCCDYFAKVLGTEKVTLFITSAARCRDYNLLQGGAANSQHTKARAMDIVISGVEPAEVYAYLDTTYPDKYGVGKYTAFTHIDTRAVKARW